MIALYNIRFGMAFYYNDGNKTEVIIMAKVSPVIKISIAFLLFSLLQVLFQHHI